MPRLHIYAPQKLIDGINMLVEQGVADGATPSEINRSSVAAELLEIGLRVKQMKNKSSGDEESAEERFRKELMKEAIKSRLVSQQVLMLLFGIKEIKEDSRNDYNKLIDWLKEQLDARMDSVFSEDK
ncbi:conjugal transfer protein TraM [Cronobacter malonaticus]|nr:conjugal transfer protein TraM [Cronobacter malonaticus]